MSRKNRRGGGELFLKNGTIDGCAYTNHVTARAGSYCAEPQALWGFSQHLPAKYSLRPNKVLPSERGSPGTEPYGKSGPGYCITFIKRLDHRA